MKIRTSDNPIRDFLVFFYVGGLVFSGIAAHFYAQARNLVENGVHAQGTVVGSGGLMYHNTWPIIAFTTASGRRVEFPRNRFEYGRYPNGTRFGVLYDRNDPSNARVDSLLDVWGPALLFGTMGLVFIALGTTVLFAVPRTLLSRPRPPDSSNGRV